MTRKSKPTDLFYIVAKKRGKDAGFPYIQFGTAGLCIVLPWYGTETKTQAINGSIDYLIKRLEEMKLNEKKNGKK